MSKIRNATVLLTFLVIISACASTGGKKGQKLSADKLQQIGENYLSAGETGLALQYLTQAEKKKPDDPVIHYDLGLAYGARGLADLSLEHFKKALALKPDYAEAFYNRGRALFKLKRLEEDHIKLTQKYTLPSPQ